MRVKLDENFGDRAAEIVSAAGHEVVTVRGEGLSGCTDDRLFCVCSDEKAVLLTLDLDFTDVTRFPPSRSHGIVVLRLPKHASSTTLEFLLRQFLRSAETLPLDAGLWIVEAGRIRIHETGR